MRIETAAGAPVADNQSALLAHWRAQSLSDGWRCVRDWFVPEVEGMAFSLMNEASLEGPARSLGAVRFVQGVGIAETMADLRSLFVTTGLPLDFRLLQEIAVGWVESGEQNPVPSSCTDASSGLVTAAHFERVLHDARRAAEGTRKLVLGTIQFSYDDARLGRDWILSAEVGRICTREFTGESAVQLYARGRIDFLIRDSPRDLADALRCKEQLELLRNGNLGPCQIRFRGIPSTDAEVMGLMAQLRQIPARGYR